jgi:uncharacterized membrane protein
MACRLERRREGRPIRSCLVAALRETSVLFGPLMAIVVLKEVMTGWRRHVLLGMVLLKMA